jgi:hypothetical protein
MMACEVSTISCCRCSITKSSNIVTRISFGNRSGDNVHIDKEKNWKWNTYLQNLQARVAPSRSKNRHISAAVCRFLLPAGPAGVGESGGAVSGEDDRDEGGPVEGRSISSCDDPVRDEQGENSGHELPKGGSNAT